VTARGGIRKKEEGTGGGVSNDAYQQGGRRRIVCSTCSTIRKPRREIRGLRKMLWRLLLRQENFNQTCMGRWRLATATINAILSKEEIEAK